MAAEVSRFDHLVQEVLDGHRSASTTTEAEDYGRQDTTGISGSGGYERKGRTQVVERTVAVGGEEEAKLANAPGCVLGGVGRRDSAVAAPLMVKVLSSSLTGGVSDVSVEVPRFRLRLASVLRCCL